MACNVGSFIGSKECHSAGHVIGNAHASERDQLERFLLKIFWQRCGHRSFDEARSYGVTGYVSRGNFASNCHGKTDQSCFRSSIARLSGLADLTKHRCYVDDPSPTLAQHGTQSQLDKQICGSEIRVENGIPVSTLHAQDELVSGNTGVIDEDFDFSEFSKHQLARTPDLFFIADVHRECCI